MHKPYMVVHKFRAFYSSIYTKSKIMGYLFVFQSLSVNH